MAAAEIYLEHLKPLVGGQITALGTTGEPDEEGNVFVGLEVTLPDGKVKTLTFLSDDEGNAPGSFLIADAEE